MCCEIYRKNHRLNSKMKNEEIFVDSTFLINEHSCKFINRFLYILKRSGSFKCASEALPFKVHFLKVNQKSSFTKKTCVFKAEKYGLLYFKEEFLNTATSVIILVECLPKRARHVLPSTYKPKNFSASEFKYKWVN